MTYYYIHANWDAEATIKAKYGIEYGRSSGYDHFDSVCQETIPLVMHCLDTTNNFHDAVLKAVTIPNGDSDTLGAIVGAISEAKYGIPPYYAKKVMEYVHPIMLDDVKVVFCQ